MHEDVHRTHSRPDLVMYVVDAPDDPIRQLFVNDIGHGFSSDEMSVDSEFKETTNGTDTGPLGMNPGLAARARYHP